MSPPASQPPLPPDRGFLWLDSATEGREHFSLIAPRPSEWISGNLWDPADYARLEEALRRPPVGERAHRGPTPLTPMRGAWAGVIGYEGDFHLGLYADYFVCRHATLEWDHVPVEDPRYFLLLQEPGLRPEDFLPLIWHQPARGPGAGFSFRSELGGAEFIALVERAQEYIAAGDIYQVNLSHRFSAWAPVAGVDAFGAYQRLRAVSPAPMAAYLELPDGRDVLCSSMETFLEMEGRAITTCPIKGTRPRTGQPKLDAAAVEQLRLSPKERAELVMITDLERNDLGQVCEYGSVRVPRFLEIEEYAQVFHQVSEVRGTLREGVSHLEALRACFPGGSITGAPKKRAREIIAELEPVPRGLYTGAIGYFGLGENAVSQWNIAIRTMVIEPPDAEGTRQAHFHVGAGIVADSEPAAEYQETLDKAAGLLLAAAQG